MDFDSKIERIEQNILGLKQELTEIKGQYKSCKIFTIKFLTTCKKLGIKKVSIGRKHKSIESSEHWPFGHKGSIFSNDAYTEESPSIWRAVEIAGISGGCGNSHQHNADCSKLIDGVYHLKKGRFIKVD